MPVARPVFPGKRPAGEDDTAQRAQAVRGPLGTKRGRRLPRNRRGAYVRLTSYSGALALLLVH